MSLDVCNLERSAISYHSFINFEFLIFTYSAILLSRAYKLVGCCSELVKMK